MELQQLQYREATAALEEEGEEEMRRPLEVVEEEVNARKRRLCEI
jgi:hypothetical protein